MKLFAEHFILQSQWAGIAPQTVASAPASAPAADLPVSTSIGPAAPVSSQTVAPAKSSWTEHTSPDGYKYYYNCVTGVSKVRQFNHSHA